MVRRPGRPRKPPEELHTRVLRIRLTGYDYELLAQRADEEGLRQGELARRIVLEWLGRPTG